MEFSIRYLVENDYATLCNWWRDWKWTPPLRDFLPENGCGGFMVYKGSIEICAGFIYFTNSKVCWSEFLISNFDYKEKDRKDALRILIHEINETAKSKGYKYVYSVVKSQSLEKTYKEMGFINGSTKVNEMVMVL